LLDITTVTVVGISANDPTVLDYTTSVTTVEKDPSFCCAVGYDIDDAELKRGCTDVTTIFWTWEENGNPYPLDGACTKTT